MGSHIALTSARFLVLEELHLALAFERRRPGLVGPA